MGYVLWVGLWLYVYRCVYGFVWVLGYVFMVGLYVVFEALWHVVGLCLGICVRVMLMCLVVFYCYMLGHVWGFMLRCMFSGL